MQSAERVLTAAEIDRFWSKVQKAGPSACWLWSKETNNQGYGRFTIWRDNKRSRPLAHRTAYRLAVGDLDETAYLLHSCDTPACCNPAHLRPGTQADNMADAKAKGRTVPPPIHRGEATHCAVLNADQVREIHRRMTAGGVTQTALAAEYGVTQSLISRIMRGKSWRHLGLTEAERRAILRRQGRGQGRHYRATTAA